MKTYYSIGEVSKIKGITIKALRYYHKMGILVPNYVDTKSGYRYYTIDQFIHIDIIKGCRALGTKIAELQEIFQKYDTNTLLEFLQTKKCEAQTQIIKMQEIITNIDLLYDSVKQAKESLNKSEIEVNYIKEREIVVIPCREIGNLKELLYYSNLDKIIEKYELEVNMEQGILYHSNLQGTLEPCYVFKGVKTIPSTFPKEYIKRLPSGNYLTLSYDNNNESQRINKVEAYAKKHQLKINTLLEIDLFDDLFHTDSYSCQMQMLLEDE